MSSLVLHDHTREQIERFVAKPSHAVQLYGPKGSGKASIATLLATKVLGIDAKAYEDFPYKTIINSMDGKAIVLKPFVVSSIF